MSAFNLDLFSQLRSSVRSSPESGQPLVRVAPDEADRFRALVEHLPVGVYRITPGPQAHRVIANRAFCDLFGVERQDVLSQAVKMTVPDQPLTPGQVTETESPFKRPDGTLAWQVISREMCAPGG